MAYHHSQRDLTIEGAGVKKGTSRDFYANLSSLSYVMQPNDWDWGRLYVGKQKHCYGVGGQLAGSVW